MIGKGPNEDMIASASTRPGSPWRKLTINDVDGQLPGSGFSTRSEICVKYYGGKPRRKSSDGGGGGGGKVCNMPQWRCAARRTCTLLPAPAICLGALPDLKPCYAGPLPRLARNDAFLNPVPIPDSFGQCRNRNYIVADSLPCARHHT